MPLIPIKFNYQAIQNQVKISYVSRLKGADWKQTWTELTGSMTFIQLFSLDFDSLFSTIDSKGFSHFVIDTLHHRIQKQSKR